MDFTNIFCISEKCKGKNIVMDGAGGTFSGDMIISKVHCPKCDTMLMIEGYEYNISATTEEQRKNEREAPMRAKQGYIKVRSRGIGMDHCSCFMCNDSEPKMMNSLSMFVNSKLEGESVVECFGRGALCNREPTWIQVKVGACDDHLYLLEALDQELYKWEKISKVMVDEIREEAVAIP